MFSIRSLLALVALAAASSAVQAATINVVAGQNLNQIMENANAGDLILVGPGTYVVQATTFVPADQFRIRKAITVRSTNGPGSTTLQGAGGATNYAVYFHAMTWSAQTHCPSGASLEGFTIVGAKGGVEVQDYTNECGTPGVINNITLKNLIVNPDSTAPNGSHGISFSNVTNSVIDSSTVTDAYNNGIYVFKGSNNLITSNTVQATTTQHAIAASNTSGATISGNTVTGSGFHGIIALGLKTSRIERNTISGIQHDGITVTNDTAPPVGFNGQSESNFIGHNTVNSTVWAGATFSDGTGIFLNGNTNGNYVFGNKLRGSPENGVALFGPSFNYLHANRVHGNYQGGILIWNNTSISGGVGGRPTNTLVRNNFIYNNPTNAMVNLRDTQGTDIAWNYLSGTNFAGDPANPTNAPGPGGAPVSPAPGGVGAALYPTDASISIYGNSIIGMTNSIYLDTDASATVYRNRLFGLGGNGVMDQYSNSPAVVAWDAGSTMGGNFWQGHSASGNPSSGTPFTDIFCPGPVGCSYQDAFPYAAETFGQASFVAVSLPRTGSSVAAGSMKTISWDSTGCSLVDLHLMNGGSPVTTIATNYPDVGYFIWNVAPAETTGSRTVRVTCKNNAGTSTGVTGTGGAFTIFAAGLTLLAPGPFATPTASGNMTVSWARGAGVTGGVNVFMSVDGAAETNPASGVTGNHVSVAVPNTNSNRVVLRIVTGANQDSSDGHFSIVRVAGGHGVSNITPGQNFEYRNRMKLEWRSYTGSRYVDIEIFNGSTYQFIAQNVPDFGNYEWLIQSALAGSNRNIRLTFKSTTSTTLTTATSSNFNINAPTTPADLTITHAATPSPANVQKDIVYNFTVTNNGPNAATSVSVVNTMPTNSTFIWATAGCNNVAGTITCNVGNLASGATAPLRIVVRPTTTTLKTNTATVSAAQTDPVPGNNTSVTNTTVNTNPAAAQVLRYRLYSDVTKEHHFTTDFNEYTVLGGFVGTWVQEGTVGRVLNNPGMFNGVTAVPYYRLYDNNTQWHHWTTDANEYYTLIQFPGWVAEGVDGYILPSTTAGAVQLFRLNYPFLGSLHHWTIDANEYNVLTTSFGWIGEGGAGFVIQ